MSSALEKIVRIVQNQSTNFHRVMRKVKFIAAENGGCIAELKIDEEHINAMGALHGSMAAVLVDDISTLGLRGLIGNKGHVSVGMNLLFIKSAKLGDVIIVDAKPLKIGKNLAFIEVFLKDKHTGELIVKGSHTKYMLNSNVVLD